VAFRDVLVHAPKESLTYLRPGDDYALGGLVVHVAAVLRHYLAVMDAIVAAGFGVSRPSNPKGLFEVAAARAHAGLQPTERVGALKEMAELHGRVRDRMASVTFSEWERKAPVWYSDEELYPTSLADIAGWLTDHYLEHVPQVGSLLADWRTLQVVEGFNRAFGRRDVEGVMDAMTPDCVFENTFPAPDGERFEGAEAVADFWRQFFAATPSARWEQEEALAAGDRAVVRWILRWDEGSDNRGHVRGVDVFRVRNGKIAEKLSYVKG